MSNKINLPFRKEFRDKILSGQKTCTSRTKQYGKFGDTFEAFGAEFTITHLERANKYGYTLFDIAHYHYREEGFDTPEEFIECWKKIHPRKGYDPDQTVYVHFFKRLDNGG